MSSVNKYEIEITLTRDMLGTNPGNPNILDAHIIEKQRKMILEEGGKVNKEINKYLNAIDIPEDKKMAEIEKLMDKLEKTTGYIFSEEQRKMALAGKLEELKETFAELDTKGVTVFYWDKEKNLPCIGDHMIYGFMKGASEALCRAVKAKKQGVVLNSASYTQSIINQHVRIEEQFLTFDRDIKREPNGSPAFNQRSLRAVTAQGPRVSLAKSEVVPAGAKLKFTLKVLKDSPLEQKHIEDIFAYGGEFAGLGQWRNAGYGMFTAKIEKVH